MAARRRAYRRASASAAWLHHPLLRRRGARRRSPRGVQRGESRAHKVNPLPRLLVRQPSRPVTPFRCPPARRASGLGFGSSPLPRGHVTTGGARLQRDDSDSSSSDPGRHDLDPTPDRDRSLLRTGSTGSSRRVRVGARSCDPGGDAPGHSAPAASCCVPAPVLTTWLDRAGTGLGYGNPHQSFFPRKSQGDTPEGSGSEAASSPKNAAFYRCPWWASGRNMKA